MKRYLNCCPYPLNRLLSSVNTVLNAEARSALGQGKQGLLLLKESRSFICGPSSLSSGHQQQSLHSGLQIWTSLREV